MFKFEIFLNILVMILSIPAMYIITVLNRKNIRSPRYYAFNGISMILIAIAFIYNAINLIDNLIKLGF